MPEIFAETAKTQRRKINLLKMVVEGEESGSDAESISFNDLKRKMKD